MMKCVIMDEHTGHQEVLTMEEAELGFGAKRFVEIMKGYNDFMHGMLVSSDTPLGYVEDEESLNYENT